VGRLVIIGGLPIAVRVLIADAARDGYEAVLLLSLITRPLGDRGSGRIERRATSRHANRRRSIDTAGAF
jgi:hypothetical protein